MKIASIIAEYNPFHSGHKYQINKLKEETDTDAVIALMSGNFVQRGTPAIYDKYTRADLALKGGADLILELPVIYSTGSAEIFAENAVKIIDALNCCDYLSFGMECDNISKLNDIADLLIDETPEFKEIIKNELVKGEPITIARAKAIEHYMSSPEVNTPNNILAIEYLKALKKINSSIIPVGITRVGSGYHSTEIMDLPSASAIRKLIESNNLEELRKYYDEISYNTITNAKPVFSDSINDILMYSLFTNKDNLGEYLDCDDKLANRINNLLESGKIYSFEDMALELKAKNYTYTRICRTLIHILLGIKNASLIQPEYVKVLGFNETGRKILKEINENSILKIIKSPSDVFQNESLQKDFYATDLYRIISKNKDLKDDFRQRPIISS